MPEEKQLKSRPINLHERRIAMPDGRYMVFFTFTDSEGNDLSRLSGAGTSRPEPVSEPQATEERNV